ncbi:putative coniferyl aldehyde dehydrogenase [Streptomyces afghaniensis 772]|nr:aldehyde dehydrogenase family protein [Streptomyces afghaniensis]EPJ34927.1 putative coniferyl aldehyde dehydrogenase [Streptomyces afghaniensis 772]
MWDAAREARLIPPTLLIDVPDDAEITREEIFGPVLTIHPYDDLAEAIAFINDRPAALAAYWYGEDGDDFRRFLQHTTSGGVTRNDGLLHASLSNAPFGGVGGSGTGAYGGKAGFDEFTHRRTVAAQTGPRGSPTGWSAPRCWLRNLQPGSTRPSPGSPLKFGPDRVCDTGMP